MSAFEHESRRTGSVAMTRLKAQIQKDVFQEAAGSVKFTFG